MKKQLNLKKFIQQKATAIFCLISLISFSQEDYPWIGNETDPCLMPATTWYLGGNNLLAPIPGPQILGSPPPLYSVQNDVGTCNNYDFILKSNNNQLVFLTTTKRIGIGYNNNLPNAVLDVFDNTGSNLFHTLIKGDQAGTIQTDNDMNLNSGNDMLLNYPIQRKFMIRENGNLRLRILNGITQNFGNFIIGSSTYNPPITAMAMIDGKGSNGLKIESDNGNDAFQVYNSAGAARVRLWVNSGLGEDTKLHFSGSAQFGFLTNNTIIDNSARLNIEANNWSSMNGLKVSVNSPASYSNNTSTNKAIYVENAQGTTTAQIAFEVLRDHSQNLWSNYFMHRFL